MTKPKIIIFANGPIKNVAKARHFAQDAAYIICADGGAAHCHHLNVLPDIVIGDMDSLPREVGKKFHEQGVAMERFPVHKDVTDLELALNHSQIRMRPEATVHIFGGLGGRWDMSLVTIFLLGKKNICENPIVIHGDQETIQALQPGEYCFNGFVGQRVSFLPLCESIVNFTASGLRYSVDNITLERGTGHGVSNFFIDTICHVKFTRGTLLMILDEEEKERV